MTNNTQGSKDMNQPIRVTRQVLILQGTSGCGKSTFAAKVELDEARSGRIYTHDVVSADAYFMRDGVYQFDPRKLGEAHATCFAHFLRALPHTDLVVVDNTNTTSTEISPYVLATQAHNMSQPEDERHDIRIIRVECADLELCAARNSHGVPLRAIQGQAARIQAFDAPGGNPLGWSVEPASLAWPHLL